MDQTVSVWAQDLDSAPPDRCARALSLLDAGERSRAQRFARELDRRRYILRHAALREILAHHAGVPASAIRFAFTPFGRPHAVGLDLDFNTSHSHGLAVVAVAAQARIGVDVEFRQDEDIDPAILQPYLSPAAYAALCARPAAHRQNAFYGWWTRVEAFAKARGSGIVMAPPPPLDGSESDTHPRVQPDDTGRQQTWHPTPLALCPTHAATLVVSGAPRPVRILRWPHDAP